MSDTKTVLSKGAQKVKDILLEFGINVPAKKIEPVVKLEDVALADGTMLMVDAMEVGAKAEYMGTDGIPVPAEGTYEVAADGTMIVCVAGAITEIKPKEVEAPVEPNADMAAQLSDLSNRLKAFEGKFEKQESEKKALEIKLSKNEKALVSTLELVDELSKTASALPLELQSQSKKKVDEPYEEMNNHRKLLFNKGKL